MFIHSLFFLFFFVDWDRAEKVVRKEIKKDDHDQRQTRKAHDRLVKSLHRAEKAEGKQLKKKAKADEKERRTKNTLIKAEQKHNNAVAAVKYAADQLAHAVQTREKLTADTRKSKTELDQLTATIRTVEVEQSAKLKALEHAKAGPTTQPVTTPAHAPAAAAAAAEPIPATTTTTTNAAAAPVAAPVASQAPVIPAPAATTAAATPAAAPAATTTAA